VSNRKHSPLLPRFINSIQVKLTNDFSRPCSDVVSRINWVAENYLHLFTWFDFVFMVESDGSSIWPCNEMKRMGECLRDVVHHYFRHQANADAASREARETAAQVAGLGATAGVGRSRLVIWTKNIRN